MKKNNTCKSDMKKGGARHVLFRLVVALLIAVLFVLGSVAGVNLYVRMSIKGRLLTSEEAEEVKDADCILVLGASVVNGDTPSPMLKDRLDKAIELYFAGCAPKLIMSGDHGGKYYNEVQVMKDYAVSKGVLSEDIFMDHAGFSTYESMYRAGKIFGADKVIVVTQRYHLYRAVYTGCGLSLDAYGVAAEDTRYSGQTKRDVREYLAVFKDFLKVIFKPEPTVLGNPIDLNGDGGVTNDK